MAEEQARPVPIDFGPAIKQVVMLVGLAVAIAAGVSLALWSQEPAYQQLYSGLASKDVVEIANVLRSRDVQYKVDVESGTVLVPAGKMNDIRMSLAAAGLPNGSAQGLELLNEEQSIGTSQFIEKARFNHALENELARSIASIRAVESARVHLALPKQTVFVRSAGKPSASVFLKLYPGRTLEDGQVDAIVHLVSSGIPGMESENVSVVDQAGRLLTKNSGGDTIARTNKQFQYARRLEADFSQRIISLLEPVVGIGRVKAQVTAELDFTSTESSKEAFDPQRKVIVSEQISEQESRQGAAASGVPGALSNQPPVAGTIGGQGAGEDGEGKLPANQSRNATRNYEVGRTVSHTRTSSGTLTRMSVAVLLDDKLVPQEDGTTKREPYSNEDIQAFTLLVKEAIGFNNERGDTLNILSSSFQQPVAEELPELPIWEQGWFFSVVKMVMGGLMVLVLMLVLVRPLLKSVTTIRTIQPAPQLEGEGAAGAPALPPGVEGAADQVTLGGGSPNLIGAAADNSYDDKLAYAKAMVAEDPRRVANVVRSWVAKDA